MGTVAPYNFMPPPPTLMGGPSLFAPNQGGLPGGFPPSAGPAPFAPPGFNPFEAQQPMMPFAQGMPPGGLPQFGPPPQGGQPNFGPHLGPQSNFPQGGFPGMPPAYPGFMPPGQNFNMLA